MVRIVYGPERHFVTQDKKKQKELLKADGYEISEISVWDKQIEDYASSIMPTAVLINLQSIDPLLSAKVDVDSLADVPVSVYLTREPTATQMKKLGGYEFIKMEKPPVEIAKKYIAAYVKKYGGGMRITGDACDALLELTGFADLGDVCLRTIFSEIDKFILLGKDIVEEDVRRYVALNPTYNAFRIVDLMTKGDEQNAVQIANIMIGSKCYSDDVFKTVGFIQKQFRVAYKSALYKDKGCDYSQIYKELGTNKIVSVDKEDALRAVKIATKCMSDIKGGNLPARQAFLGSVIAISELFVS